MLTNFSSSSNNNNNTFSHLCSTLVSAFHFSLQSRDIPLQPASSELSFFSPETGQWRPFSSLHMEGNLVDSSFQNSSSIRERTCRQWMSLKMPGTTAEMVEEEEVATCLRVVDGCNLAAYLVDRQAIARVPSPCLACTLPRTSTASLVKQTTRFGSRRVITSPADQAQVVFVLDGSCHQARAPANTARLLAQLNALAKVVEKEFRARRVRTRFMVRRVGEALYCESPSKSCLSFFFRLPLPTPWASTA
mgnify:CR=1 FL=1